MLPSEAGQGFQVGHLHQGIGDGFQVEDPGVGFQDRRQDWGSSPGMKSKLRPRRTSSRVINPWVPP